MKTRVYVQTEHFADIKLVELDDEATLEELKLNVLALLPPGCETADLEMFIEDEDDLPKVKHVKHLKKEHGIRVHLHRCKHIAVQVRFGSEVVRHDFQPATTIGRIRQWAGHELGMQPGDVAEHVLQISGTNEQPDIDTHVGALAKAPACSVVFDFVPAHRING
jgi:hypothetical protein